MASTVKVGDGQEPTQLMLPLMVPAAPPPSGFQLTTPGVPTVCGEPKLGVALLRKEMLEPGGTCAFTLGERGVLKLDQPLNA